jgi:hypothetical protein
MQLEAMEKNHESIINAIKDLKSIQNTLIYGQDKFKCIMDQLVDDQNKINLSHNNYHTARINYML